VTNREDWPAPIVLADPQPGDFVCVPVSGPVGIGITIGQWLDGDRFQFYDHTAIYVGQPDEAGPYGYTVSTYPNGKCRRALPVAAAQLPGSLWSSGLITPGGGQRAGIVAWALAHQDVHYSFLDYGALVTHALHIPAPGLRGYINSTAHMICSQYVTAGFQANGVHLFPAGRWDGYVKPGDLAKLLQQLIANRFTTALSGSPAPACGPVLCSPRRRPADTPARGTVRSARPWSAAGGKPVPGVSSRGRETTVHVQT
jgi:hypothetical protein